MIEQLYSTMVLKHFPTYGKFWEKFIGVKSHVNFPGKIFPYGLRFSSTFQNEERSRLERIYEELTMAHYSLFCSLAGAHYQVAQLERTLGLGDTQTKQFEHWEAFEVAYLHLGIVFNEIHHLWDILSDLEVATRSLGTQLMKATLSHAGKAEAWKKFNELECDIKARRDNVTHYARGASRSVDGKVYVPLHQARNVLWTLELESKEWIQTLPKAKADLRQVEGIANAIHELLIERLDTYFTKKQVQVDYEATS